MSCIAQTLTCWHKSYTANNSTHVFPHFHTHDSPVWPLTPLGPCPATAPHRPPAAPHPSHMPPGPMASPVHPTAAASATGGNNPNTNNSSSGGSGGAGAGPGKGRFGLPPGAGAKLRSGFRWLVGGYLVYSFGSTAITSWRKTKVRGLGWVGGWVGRMVEAAAKKQQDTSCVGVCCLGGLPLPDPPPIALDHTLLAFPPAPLIHAPRNMYPKPPLRGLPHCNPWTSPFDCTNSLDCTSFTCNRSTSRCRPPSGWTLT